MDAMASRNLAAVILYRAPPFLLRARTKISPTLVRAVNWPSPSYDPQTGLFYVGLHQGYVM
jgi:hypothetical protein